MDFGTCPGKGIAAAVPTFQPPEQALGHMAEAEAAKDWEEPLQGTSARLWPSTDLEKRAEVRVSPSVLVMGRRAKAYPSQNRSRANLQA